MKDKNMNKYSVLTAKEVDELVDKEIARIAARQRRQMAKLPNRCMSSCPHYGFPCIRPNGHVNSKDMRIRKHRSAGGCEWRGTLKPR